MKKNSQKETSGESKKKRGVIATYFHDVRSGKIVSGDWFVKNWPYMFVLILAMFIYITCRFSYASTMESIIAERKHLNSVHAEEVRQRSIYNSRICETSMQQLVDSLHLDLTVQTQPPFILEK